MKKLLIILFVIVTILSVWAYSMDNVNLVKLPDGVLSYEYDLTSSFLIPLEEDKYILIDTGYEKNYSEFRTLLAKDKISISQISFVFVTHHHDDHSGFLNNIILDNDSIQIILHEKTIPLLLQGQNNTNNGGGIVNPLMNTLFEFKQLITPDWDFTFPVYNVRDNDIVLKGEQVELKSLIGIDATMLYTPGHTSDSISFIYKKQTIFCGDLASNLMNFAGSSNLTIFNENIDDVYQSWQKVIDLNILNVIPAHGKAFSIQSLKKNLHKYTNAELVPYVKK